MVRRAVVPASAASGGRWSILGQSFGGFCWCVLGEGAGRREEPQWNRTAAPRTLRRPFALLAWEAHPAAQHCLRALHLCPAAPPLQTAAPPTCPWHLMAWWRCS